MTPHAIYHPAVLNDQKDEEQRRKRKKVKREIDRGGGHKATAHAEADTFDEPDISRVHDELPFQGGGNEKETEGKGTAGDGWKG